MSGTARSSLTVVSWLLAQALVASAATPADIRVVPELETITVILSGAAPGVPAGAFSGSVSLNGSSSEVPINGLARASGGRLELSVKMRYRDVPEDWIKRLRASDFDYRLRGRVTGGRPMEWSGTSRWDQVEVEKRKDEASDFVKLTSIQLTQFSLLESAARAEVTCLPGRQTILAFRMPSWRWMSRSGQRDASPVPRRAAGRTRADV